MMNSVSAWLLLAQVLVISTAQDVGRFAYKGSYFKMYYDVNEKKEVTLTVEVIKPLYVIDAIPGVAVRSFGSYPLRKDEGFTYTIDFENSGITSADWHQSIYGFIVETVLFVPDRFYPADLTTLTYLTGDAFSVDLRGEHARFLRVGGDLSPGEYVYEEPVSPHMRMIYKIYRDGTAGLQVECKRIRTARFPHKLAGRETGFLYRRHVVEPVWEGPSWEGFLNQVRQVCPWKHQKPGDFEEVVVATEKTIYVAFEGVRLPLTKV
ncbi:hypothetical protein FOZ61_002355 [Perkinsus olseni]|uniref:Uncharacterized protein n=1 Tax=Perkinsus olseni TaxID=32597 RepID=A0A7J6MMI6_PEROL|nr:hypothetical protein FOZ61_002355 [Perkinsus olseni]KAF4672161.1 hypothetical protein FOL46_009394 [Perkinsus olseni]